MAPSLSKLHETTGVKQMPARPLVLIADDDPDTRLLFRTVLEVRGCCIVEAADGEETVRTAESARPDLILMDGSLPRMNGLDAARLIRRSGQVVPIVFISGHAGEAFITRAREAGCDEYLVKPFALTQLEDLLKKYCGKASGRGSDLEGLVSR